MQEDQFNAWLLVDREMKPQSAVIRISVCKRVEYYEGDLDTHYNADELAVLMDRLNAGRPKHRVAISGNVYIGTVTLKSSVRLYRDFRDARDRAGWAEGPLAKQRQELLAHEQREAVSAVWQSMADARLFEFAQAMTPSVQFLEPGIVRAVAEDNRALRADWSCRLEALGIEPAMYLWDGSPCAFPGVRRFTGATEFAVFRQRATAPEMAWQCLALDENDYVRELWSFVFTGKPFDGRDPHGYRLAHLFDRKEHAYNSFDLDILAGADELRPPYGLVTSPASSAYLPTGYVSRTDSAPRLRNLLQRRALQLYGDMCRMVPPPLRVKALRRPRLGTREIPLGRARGRHAQHACVSGVPSPAHGGALCQAPRGVARGGRPMTRMSKPSDPACPPTMPAAGTIVVNQAGQSDPSSPYDGDTDIH